MRRCERVQLRTSGGTVIKLSEIKKENWQLLREGSFESLGLCNARAGLPLLTFCGGKKFLETALKNPDIACMLITPEMADWESVKASDKGICVVPNLRMDFFKLHNKLCEGEFAERYCGKPERVHIGAGSAFNGQAYIASQNVRIGRNVTIEPFACIYENTIIGDNCIIRSGSVLGGTGLEFIRNGDAGLLPVTHKGWLEIGENVEIQYNCNISRSLFPWHRTLIGKDTKIESLVHIAHGVHMGERCLVAASACIAGSAILGNDVWVGPNATISSEVKIGNGARVNLGAVAAGNVPAGQTVTGNFAIAHDLFLQDLMKKML